MRPAGLFLYPGTLAGAAPCGEDLTLVVVAGDERVSPFRNHTGVDTPLSLRIWITVEVMDIQGHAPFKARGGLGGASYGLDMV